MSAEQFANLAETTLASAYTAGGTVLSVTSAADFPATGPFRLRLGNVGRTIWRVDYVTGTLFFGAAEARDADALTAATVTCVWTKGSAERLLQAPDPNAIVAPSGLVGAVGYGPLYRMGSLPNLDTWTWVNQGTSFYRQGGGLAELNVQSGAATNTRLLYTALPARPFRITAGFVPFLNWASGGFGNLLGIGLGPYEIASTKFIFFGGFNFNLANGLQTSGGAIALQSFSAPTTATTLYFNKLGQVDFPNPGGTSNLLPPFGLIWFRMTDDGVNCKYEWSWDKVFWNLIGAPQSRVTGFTTAPDALALMLFAQTVSVTPTIQGYLVSWELDVPDLTVPSGALGLTGNAPTLV